MAVFNFNDWFRRKRAAAEDTPPASTAGQGPRRPLGPIDEHYAAMKLEGRDIGLADGLIENPASIAALTDFVTAATTALQQPPWDPVKNAGDRNLQDRADRLRAELVALHAVHDGAETLRRELSLRLPTDRQAPTRPWGLIGFGVATLAIGFGLSLEPTFRFLGDPVLIWACALCAGLAIAGLITTALFR